MVSDQLISQAKQAYAYAYAPYSQFKVGAVLLCQNDRIITGCNIEVSSQSLTICAERMVIFKALSEGIKDFKHLVIYTDTEEFCPPCGACRQVIFDFAPSLTITLVNRNHDQQDWTIHDLYPQPFGPHFFNRQE